MVDGVVTLATHAVGVHQILAYPPTPDGPSPEPIASLEVATNLASPVESQIAPATDLTLGGRALAAPPTFAVSARRDLWLYVVLAVVLLLCVEWITYHRRITV